MLSLSGLPELPLGWVSKIGLSYLAIMVPLGRCDSYAEDRPIHWDGCTMGLHFDFPGLSISMTFP